MSQNLLIVLSVLLAVVVVVVLAAALIIVRRSLVRTSAGLRGASASVSRRARSAAARVCMRAGISSLKSSKSSSGMGSGQSRICCPVSIPKVYRGASPRTTGSAANAAAWSPVQLRTNPSVAQASPYCASRRQASRACVSATSSA